MKGICEVHHRDLRIRILAMQPHSRLKTPIAGHRNHRIPLPAHVKSRIVILIENFRMLLRVIDRLGQMRILFDPFLCVLKDFDSFCVC